MYNSSRNCVIIKMKLLSLCFIFILPFILYSIELESLGPYGGNISCFEISISNPKIIFAATNESGIFKSIDGGQNWNSLEFKNNIVISISVDSYNPDIVYISSINFLTDELYIYETFKSNDGGKSWTNLGFQSNIIKASPIIPGVVYFGNNEGLYISYNGGEYYEKTNFISENQITFIAPDPLDSSVIYLATNFAVYKSLDKGVSWLEIKDVTRFSNSPGYVNDISISELNNNILLVATSHNGLLISTDGGFNWTNKDFGIQVRSINCDRTNENILYLTHLGGLFISTDLGISFQKIKEGRFTLSANTDSAFYIYDQYYGMIYKSHDNCKTWEQSSNGIKDVGIESMLLNENELFVISYSGLNHSLQKYCNGYWDDIIVDQAGYELYFNSFNNEIYKIGGNDFISYSSYPYSDWELINNGLPPCKLNDLAINQNTLYLATSISYDGIYSGIYKTVDGGKNWSLSSNGLPTAEREKKGILYTEPIDIYSICINGDNSEDVFAGAFQDIYKSDNEGNYWSRLARLDSIFINKIMIDPIYSNIIYTIGGNHYYGKNNSLYISTDFGISFNSIELNLEECLCLHYDTTNNLLYSGGRGGIYKSLDHGLTWIKQENIDTNLVVTDIISESVSNVLYIGTQNSGIFKLNLNNSSVSNIDANMNSYISNNYPNPFNPSTVINYHLSIESKINISIYDVNGRKLFSLTNGYQSAGYHTINWDTSSYSSGMYLCVLLVNGLITDTHKLILIK